MNTIDYKINQALCGLSKKGVGHQLIERMRAHLGEQVSLILLSAPQAMGYYPKVGFTQIDNAFAIKRKH